MTSYSACGHVMYCIIIILAFMRYTLYYNYNTTIIIIMVIIDLHYQ